MKRAAIKHVLICKLKSTENEQKSYVIELRHLDPNLMEMSSSFSVFICTVLLILYKHQTYVMYTAWVAMANFHGLGLILYFLSWIC